MANIVVNNWQSIQDTSPSNDIEQSFSIFDSLFSDFANVSYYSMTNTSFLGNYYGPIVSYDLVVNGNHFLDGSRTIIFNSFVFTNANTSIDIKTNLSVNAYTGSFSGYLSKITYASNSGDTFEVSGKYNLNANGDLIGGTLSHIQLVSNGNTIDVTGSVNINANGEAVGGNITGYSIKTNLGYEFTANGFSISYAMFNSLTDPALGHSNLSDLYNYITIGNDTVTGSDDIDTIAGGSGNDILDGGLGADMMNGGKGNDTYLVDNAGDVVTEDFAYAQGGGIDTVKSSISYTLGDHLDNLTLTGTDNINATGNALNNTVTGNVANNVLMGDAGNDILTGNAGDDTLEGGEGIDKLYGGLGDDTYHVDLIQTGKAASSYRVALQDAVIEGNNAGTDTVVLHGNFDHLYATTLGLGSYLEHLDASQTGLTKLNLTGNTLDNTITGNDADNTLNGGAGNDTLNGGAGNDTLDGSTGVDTLAGGVGDDTYLVDLIYTGIAPNLTASLQDSISELSDEGNDTLKLRGSLTKLTTPTLITLTGSLDHVENLDISATASTKLDIEGNAANNTLIGNSAANILTGNAGDDILDGKAGADTMIGGTGDDTYYVDNIGDVVTESIGDGTDTISSTITYNLSTNANNVENLTLLGSSAINATGDDLANTLTGNTGSNILDGGLSADTMNGGKGNDTYLVDNAGDVVTEDFTYAQGGGIDTVNSSISYALGENLDNLTLTGTANINGSGNALNNIITGNVGDNVLDGAAGNDTLIGGDGNDNLTGGAGIDKLTGGKGNDTYNIDLVRTSALATSIVALQDTVSELANPLNSTVEGIDTIILTNLTGNAGAPIDTSNITNATTLIVNANVENFDASQTGDIKLNITGNALANTITGNDADNILNGGAGNDTLNGGAGNDTLDGSLGVDTLTGGTGNDTYLVDIIATTTVAPAPIVVTGAQLQDSIVETNGTADGIDTLKLRGSVTIPAATQATNIALTGTLANIENLDISLTGVSRLNITGNDENNILIGNAAVNTLTGGDGMDFLDGKAGADIMMGGAGVDTYVVDNAGDVVIEQPDEGDLDMINSFISFDLSTKGANVEYLNLVGSAIIGTGNELNNGIYGNSLANILSGGAGNDLLDGGAGNDILDGGNGTDTMEGGNGSDTYVVDDVSDTVIETNAVLATGGTDLVKASIDYALTDNVENLTLTDGSANGGTAALNGTGNALNNIITGNAGNNVLDGATGIDRLVGGLGDDTYLVDLVQTGTTAATYRVALQDTISELAGIGSGTDTVKLRGNFDHLNATALTLGTNLENLDASATGITKLNLTGNTLANTITGNDADNTLDGGSGSDTLIGGLGNDTYVLDLKLSGTGVSANVNTFDDTVTESNGTTDGVDTIKLRGTATLTNASTLVLDGQWSNVEILDASATGATKLNLTGNDEDNILTGNAAANTLNGGDGNDTLNGGAGADTLIGGDGDDTYFADVIKPTTGAGGDVIIDSSGTDTAKTTFSADLKSSQFDGIENLSLLGTAALNATGDDGNNVLIGNDGANTIDGGTGADVMAGGKGNDTYIVDDFGDTVTEVLNGGTDLVKSRVDFVLGDNIENLMLIGTLNGTGNALNNHITGNALNNILDGQAGIDTMIGGDGNDTYFVDNVGDIVSETNSDLFLGGTDLVWTYINYTLATNVENLNIANTNGLVVSGNALNNNIFGNAGNDVLNGEAGSDYLVGDRGDDTLDGGTGSDYLSGMQGSDTYIVDVTFSGSGGTFRATLQDTVDDNDSNSDGLDMLKLRGIYTGTTAQTISRTDYIGTGIEGIDISLTGNSKLNIVAAGSAPSHLIGNTAANWLQGSFNNDILDGGLGSDTLEGLDGNDIYVLDVVTDVIINETSGNDTAKTAFSAILGVGNLANIENLTLTGTANLNATGDDGNNVLIGNVGANTIIGGAGDDAITGGAGNDNLTGGLGVNTFAWNLADKGKNGLPAIDRITDFNIAEDRLDLRDLLVGESSANILNFLDVTTSTAAGVTNTEIRISNTGGFAGGTFTAAAENQHISLAGVNLLTGTNETDLLATLITQNRLIIDV